MPIYDENFSDFDGVQLTTGLADPVKVLANGVVLNDGTGTGRAFDLNNGPYSVTVDGLIAAYGISPTGNGIYISPAAAGAVSTIKISAAGSVFAGAAEAIYAGHATNISNAGIIRSDANAAVITIDSLIAHKIDNKGRIEAIAGTSLNLSPGIDSDFCDAILFKGTGTHTLTNSGFIVGNIVVQEGNAIITNKGTITGSIETGAGNDKVTNTGQINVGYVYLGAGNDVFTGGKGTEFVADGDGTDSYKLGDGFDVFMATSSGTADGIDKVDGGGQNNTYFTFIGGLIYDEDYPINFVGDVYMVDDAPGSASLAVNLNNKAMINHVVAAGTFAASTATGLDVGTDLIKGFEAVFGSAAGDTMFGNALSNLLTGGDGGDTLFGGGGNDFLYGGAGADKLGGDLGSDFIHCEDSDTTFDGAMDTIYFLTLKDSTVAASGRDRIYEFRDSEDRISFEHLHLTGTPAIFMDANFSGPAGSPALRVLHTGQGWTLQLDADGDHKADMAFDVVDASHAIVWDASDFLV